MQLCSSPTKPLDSIIIKGPETSNLMNPREKNLLLRITWPKGVDGMTTYHYRNTTLT